MDITFTHRSEEVFTDFFPLQNNGGVENSFFVIKRDGDAGAREVHACIASQAGCAFRCMFCASGQHGLARNLTVAEMLGEIVRLETLASEKFDTFSGRFDRIDLMGSGEFLSNPRWKEFLELLYSNKPEYRGRVSLASVGSPSKILRLASSGSDIHTFWMSLHGVRQTVRDRLLPVASRFSPGELIDATIAVRDGLGCKVRVNYLTYDFNTTEADAMEIISLFSGTGLTLQLSQPNGEDVESGLSRSEMASFATSLNQAGLKNRVILFFSAKGEDEAGGCGRLRYIS